jgi:hypothetical protein
MKKNTILLILICVVMLVGCKSPSSTLAPTLGITTLVLEGETITPLSSSTTTASISPTSTHSPIHTATPTITPLPATPTPIPLPLHAFEKRCAVIQDSLPQRFLSEGTVFLYKEAYPSSSVYVLSSQDMILQKAPEILRGDGHGVSPDWKWLAYGSTGQILIMGPTGEVRASQPWNERWHDVQSWLDPERLTMVLVEKEPVAVDVFNPFTGEGETLNPGLDDVFRFNIESPGTFSWYIWKLVYDPSLTRLVYLREKTDPFEISMVMINTDSHQTVWEYKSPQGADLNMPVWSPDGLWLLFVSLDVGSNFELYTVNKEGQEIQWINIASNPGIYGEWRWSPDNRYIAFHGDSLYVLDTEEHQLIDYCIPYSTGLDKSIGGIFQSIFWSPDSSQILFQRVDAPALVVDLASGIAAPLVDDTSIRPVGWIRENP